MDQGKLRRQELRKSPTCRDRPQHKAHKGERKHKAKNDTPCYAAKAQRKLQPRTIPTHRNHTAHPGRKAFKPAPEEDEANNQTQLQNRPRTGEHTQIKLRRIHPAQDHHNQQRRVLRTQYQGHFRRCRTIGKHRQKRQPDPAIKLRQDHFCKSRHPPIAQHTRGMKLRLGPQLRQSGKAHKKQKRHFLQDQPCHQAHAPSIMHDEPIRWPVQSGKTENQARRCDDQRKPHSNGCMRHGQKWRQQMPQHAKALGVMGIGQHQHGNEKG